MSIAEKVLQLKQDFDDVYEAGKQAGGGGNTDEAFENGKKEMWKGITNHGTRVNYANGFQYTDLDYFYPYTDLQPTNAGYMFAQTRNNGLVDLVTRFEEYGTTLDFANATAMARTFYVSGVTRLGVIDCRSATALDFFVCSSSYLHTIELMIVDADNTYNSTFNACSALEEIRFSKDSVIGNNINFSDCNKLSHDSIVNDDETGIINVLATLESGVTRTLSLGSTNLAKLTGDEKEVATKKGWTLA